MRTRDPTAGWAWVAGTVAALSMAACAPSGPQELIPITVHASSAAHPWLDMAFACVSPAAAIVLSQEADSDITLRLSEPQELAFPAYQVGSDELLVITHPLVGVGGLTPVQVEGLFAGQFTSWSSVGGSDQPVHVWAYAAAVDIQSYFERVILHDRPVSSLARLAVSAQHMSDSVGSVPGSIGLLPRRWATGNLHEALLVANIPVLALTQSAPSGEVAHLLECMQAKRK